MTSPEPVATAVISAMITPAFLIMASGSLVGSALLRLGRSVDHTRAIMSAVQNGAAAPDTKSSIAASLSRLKRRSFLAEAAVAVFFAATTVFVGDSLAILVDRQLSGSITWLPIGLVVVGVMLLLTGAVLMTAECWVSAGQIGAEIEHARGKLQ